MFNQVIESQTLKKIAIIMNTDFGKAYRQQKKLNLWRAGSYEGLVSWRGLAGNAVALVGLGIFANWSYQNLLYPWYEVTIRPGTIKFYKCKFFVCNHHHSLLTLFHSCQE